MKLLNIFEWLSYTSVVGAYVILASMGFIAGWMKITGKYVSPSLIDTLSGLLVISITLILLFIPLVCIMKRYQEKK